jgi:hypothetical protein
LSSYPHGTKQGDGVHIVSYILIRLKHITKRALTLSMMQTKSIVTWTEDEGQVEIGSDDASVKKVSFVPSLQDSADD